MGPPRVIGGLTPVGVAMIVIGDVAVAGGGLLTGGMATGVDRRHQAEAWPVGGGGGRWGGGEQAASFEWSRE